MRGYKLDACEVSQVDERVRTTAETYALGVIDDVSAVLAGDAVEQRLNQVGMVGSVPCHHVHQRTLQVSAWCIGTAGWPP